MYDYLIVGAGLFGSVFAREMTDRGSSCLVVEKRQTLGGNLYTYEDGGIHVHAFGPHIFHTDSEALWHYVNRFAEFAEFVNQPLADYKGERYNLPFNMHTFRQMWGITDPATARKKIEEQRTVLQGRAPQNLKEQAISLVGTDIYEKLVKGYTEKQWGRACDELSPDIIKRLPVRFTYNNNYFNHALQGVPKNGYTQMIESMLHGIPVLRGVEYLARKAELDAMSRKTLYTGQIDAYFGYCYGKLAYRSLRFVHERLQTPDFQGNAVINYTDRETPYTRIVEHKHFTGASTPHTVITKEYPEEWNGENEAYYPIADEKNLALYEKYRVLGEAEPRMLFGGRLAEYKYYDMDQVILAALRLAECCDK